MNSLDNMKNRLNFRGGNAEGRIQQGKLMSLRMAIRNSYQSEEITTNSGAKFKCLINPDKTKQDYDDKVLSIPFKDFNLNATPKEKKRKEDYIDTNLQCGDIFHWNRTNTDWIIYLIHYNEDSYLRAEIRRCKYEILADGRRIKCYVRGPVETALVWAQKKNVEYNSMNYSLSMLVTATEENLKFFHRFARISLKGHTWRVVAIDDFSTDGIIEVLCEEDSDNKFDNPADVLPKVVPIDDGSLMIQGEDSISAKSLIKYNLINIPSNLTSGSWSVDTDKVKIIEDNFDSVIIYTDTYKSLKFNLNFNSEGENLVTKELLIESF